MEKRNTELSFLSPTSSCRTSSGSKQYTTWLQIPCFLIIRRKILSTWKEKKGFDATYKNLLELFLKAGHTECAGTICTVLERRGRFHNYIKIMQNYVISTVCK